MKNLTSHRMKLKRGGHVRPMLWVFLTASLMIRVWDTSWAFSPQTLGSVTLTRVAPSIVTPNGDTFNDIVFFEFDDTIAGLPLETSVLDINGAKVASLALNGDADQLTWDGKDESGRDLPSGIYIYYIRIGKKTVNGTIVVAR